MVIEKKNDFVKRKRKSEVGGMSIWMGWRTIPSDHRLTHNLTL